MKITVNCDFHHSVSGKKIRRQFSGQSSLPELPEFAEFGYSGYLYHLCRAFYKREFCNPHRRAVAAG